MAVAVVVVVVVVVAEVVVVEVVCDHEGSESAAGCCGVHVLHVSGELF